MMHEMMSVGLVTVRFAHMFTQMSKLTTLYHAQNLRSNYTIQTRESFDCRGVVRAFYTIFKEANDTTPRVPLSMAPCASYGIPSGRTRHDASIAFHKDEIRRLAEAKSIVVTKTCSVK